MIGYILNPEHITKKIFETGRYDIIKESRWRGGRPNEERAAEVKEMLEYNFERLLNEQGTVSTKELCQYASRPVVGRFLRGKISQNIITYRRKANDAWYERV